MPSKKTVLVVNYYDPQKDYGVTVPNIFKKVIPEFKKGEVFEAMDFAKNILPNYTKSKNAESLNKYAWQIVRFGAKIGVFEVQNKLDSLE